MEHWPPVLSVEGLVDDTVAIQDKREALQILGGPLALAQPQDPMVLRQIRLHQYLKRCDK